VTVKLSLKEIEQLPKSECSCNRCKKMCSESRPCWGTPNDMKRIIENGFTNRIMLDYYEGELDNKTIKYTEIVTPALVGCEGSRAPFWPVGRCTFYTDDGKCEIHDIKPTEGCVVNHKQSYDGLHTSLVETWTKRAGKDVVKLWQKKMSE
jgi:Fe-S-cluster containining protein